MKYKILAENLVRFGVKNIDIVKFHNQFLVEQDQQTLINFIKNNIDMYNAYRDWEEKNKQKVKLVKGFGYETIGKEESVVVEFFNNFVTIDQGTANPDAQKQKIDDVLDTLRELGANLESPETIIEIISTATSPQAGTNLDKGATSAGRKSIDHDYNLKLNGAELKTKLQDIQKRDPQWGNRILATKRGESAKKYIESREDIKAKVIVKTQINAKERKFMISAKIKGKQKYIAPLNIPKLTIDVNFRIEKAYRSLFGRRGGGDAMYAYTYEPILSVSVGVTTNFGIFGSNTNFAGSNGAVSSAGQLALVGNPAPTYTRTAFISRAQPQDLQGGKDGNPFVIHSTGYVGGNRNAEEFSGISPEYMLTGIGQFTKEAASTIQIQLRSITSPLMEALHKQGLSDKIEAVVKEVKTKRIEQFKEGDDTAKAWESVNFPTIEFSQKFNAAELAAAAIAIGKDASVQRSSDVKYWMNAVYYDSTTDPATYGNLSQNPQFLDGATWTTD